MGRTSEFRTDENGRHVLKASYIMKKDRQTRAAPAGNHGPWATTAMQSPFSLARQAPQPGH
jgi:hypothetical protein